MWGFLLAITGPLVVRVLLTLGLGVVTLTGLSSVLSYVYNHIQTSLSALSADVAGLLFLSGVPQAVAIVLSALAARLTYSTMSKIQRLV